VTADVRDRLRQLTEAHAAATAGPWESPYPFTKLIDAPGSTDNMAIVQCDSAADAAAIVAEHNAVPDLIAALTAVLDLADELDGRAKGLRDQALDLRRHRFPDSARLRDEEATDLAELAARIRAAVAAAGGEDE
jgi:hypothetical protein